MRFIICLFILFMAESYFAQDLKYSINVPDGLYGGLGNRVLCDSNDTNHYYKYYDLFHNVKPVVGWDNFYAGLEALDYPKKAKKQKLEAAISIVFKIDERGAVDSLSVSSFKNDHYWSKCVDCEKLVFRYFKNSKWVPGKIGHIPVKSSGWANIEFTIYDPNSEKKKIHLGFNNWVILFAI